MGKIKEFFNGFRKIDYDVDLEGKPGYFKIPMRTIQKVVAESEKIPVMNLRFKILDIDIRKNQYQYYGIIRHDFQTKACDYNPEYFIKVSKTRYRKHDLRHTEFVIDCIANFNAVDGEIWTLDIAIMITCGTFNSVFDDQIAGIAITIANGIVSSMKLDNMLNKRCVSSFLFPNIENIRDQYSAFTEGLVRTYSTYSHPYGIDKAIPNYLHNDATVSFENIFTAVLEDEDGKDGIFKVLRKNED